MLHILAFVSENFVIYDILRGVHDQRGAVHWTGSAFHFALLFNGRDSKSSVRTPFHCQRADVHVGPLQRYVPPFR